jgi:hypothetical protein
VLWSDRVPPLSDAFSLLCEGLGSPLFWERQPWSYSSCTCLTVHSHHRRTDHWTPSIRVVMVQVKLWVGRWPDWGWEKISSPLWVSPDNSALLSMTNAEKNEQHWIWGSPEGLSTPFPLPGPFSLLDSCRWPRTSRVLSALKF